MSPYLSHLRHISAGALAIMLILFARAAESGEPNAQPAEKAGPAVAELQKALDEAESKLSTALRSYTLLQREFDDFKTAASRNTDRSASQVAELQAKVDAVNQALESARAEAREKAAALSAVQEEITALRAAAINHGMEVSTLRDQNRQLLAVNAHMAEENASFRTRLALQGPGPAPAGGMAVPLRPGTPAAQQAIIVTPPEAKPAPKARPQAATPAGSGRQHIIKDGETLSKISRQYYGTADRWPEIYAANRDILSSPSRLPTGASLRIP